jgi:DNA-binding transcriptional ArsR family regulator
MSSGVADQEHVASLRAMAHPLRLRILSLLTGTAMSAAEVARELDTTHANASYHLRQLHAAGLLYVAEEQAIRGGRAKRYRHNPTVDVARDRRDPGVRVTMWRALADELLRRSSQQAEGPGHHQHLTDAELWVPREVWQEVTQTIHEASLRLHTAAQAPRSPGAIHTSTTIALFEMADARNETSLDR